jgi:parallel beta-helix repeat protein
MILSSATPPLPGNETLIVDDSGDAEDADPDDGVCATDTGVCTLRAAIQQANAQDNETDSVTFISFNIPGDAPHRIQPRSSLPAITVPVFIDGTTQPGSDGATTLNIELDGSRAGNGASGLTIIGGNSAVQGLVIHSFEDYGVLIDNAHNNTVGTADAGNSISGNQLDGILISGMSTMNQVLKNDIDANRNGVAIVGTGLANTIQDNQIFNNLFNGILVSGTSTANQIQGNSIYANAELGIDLGDDGVTPNDVADADMGVNNLQNAPELSSAVTVAQRTIIKGRLNSAPDKTYTLEFFATTACDDSGSGEGESFIGSITTTTDALGEASFVFFRLIAQQPGVFITATATDPDGNTSEFSACVMIE